MVVLRPYQEVAVEALRQGIRQGHKQQVLCSPTGSGKTEVGMWFVESALSKGKKACFLCDRISLVEQTSRRFFDAGIPHGVAQGDATTRRWEPIQVASAQTIEKRGFWPDLDLLIVDEAHIQRRNTLEFIRNVGCVTIGLTATPFAAGMAETYSNVVNARTTTKLLEDGWLCPVKVYAGTEINMAGAGRKPGGEWADRAAEERGIQIIGDIVPEWVAKTHEHFGGPVKTLMFGPTVAFCQEVCAAFQALGYDFRTSSYRDDQTATTHMIEEFRQGKFVGLASVDKFCLDDQTEILTASGWVGIDDMRDDHEIANWWEDGYITFSRPQQIHRRRVEEGEVWVYSSDRVRVTGNHRMVTKHRGWRWNWMPATELAGKSRLLPISGIAQPASMEAPPEEPGPSSSIARRIASNAYHLRRQGLSLADARAEAERRIRQRQRLRRKQPAALSLDECRLIGFWLGDGSRGTGGRGGTSYTLSQSLRYPKIVTWVDALLRRLHLDARRKQTPPTKLSDNPAILWTLPRGTGFGPQRRRGVYALEPYLQKSGTPAFWGLSEDQFAALLEGLLKADGEHDDAERHRIGNTNYALLSLLQSIAVCRGWRASLRNASPPQKPHHSQCYYLTLRRGVSEMQLRFTAEPVTPGERAWCVSVESGAIVTRRGGRVVVVGNSRGFDVPDVLCLIAARPYSKSFSAWIQTLGRIMRIADGKIYGLVLDHTGNYVSWFDDMKSFFDNGVSNLREATPDSNRERKTREKKEAACPVCGYAMPEGMISPCPSCGASFEMPRSSVFTVPGQMQEVTGITSKRGAWKEDRTWTWHQICRIASARHPRDDDRARKFALAQYRAMYDAWPIEGWERDNRPADRRVESAVSYRIGKWRKSLKDQRAA